MSMRGLHVVPVSYIVPDLGGYPFWLGRIYSSLHLSAFLLHLQGSVVCFSEWSVHVSRAGAEEERES